MRFHTFFTVSKMLLIAGVGGTGAVAHAQAVNVSAAEATLYRHLTTDPKAQVVEVNEEYRMVKSNDAAEIKNLVRFILSGQSIKPGHGHETTLAKNARPQDIAL